MNLKLCPLLVTWDDVFILIFVYFYFWDFDANLGLTLQPRSQFFNASPYFQSIPLTMIQLCCDMTTMVTFTSPFRATVYPWNCHSGRLTNSAALRNRKSMHKSEWKLRSKYSNSNPQSRFQKVIAYLKKNHLTSIGDCARPLAHSPCQPWSVCEHQKTDLKSRKNCESCWSQVTWKVKFECQFCLSCPVLTDGPAVSFRFV